MRRPLSRPTTSQVRLGHRGWPPNLLDRTRHSRPRRRRKGRYRERCRLNDRAGIEGEAMARRERQIGIIYKPIPFPAIPIQHILTHLSQQLVEEERAGHKWRDSLRYAQPHLTNTHKPNQTKKRNPPTNYTYNNSVSQFTLYGHLKKGNKPDFHEAADAETARKLYDYFIQRLSDSYKPERVKNGVFQAMMEVELKNDGPVGVDYRSEDAVVKLLPSPLPANSYMSSKYMLIVLCFVCDRLRLRLIRNYRRRRKRNNRLARRMESRRHSSLSCRRS